MLRVIASAGLDALRLHHFQDDGAPALKGISERHTFILNRTGSVGIACSIGRSELNHTGRAGNVAVIPAGIDWTANADGPLDNIVLSVAGNALSAVAARAGRPFRGLVQQMRGHDETLRAIIDEIIAAAPYDLRPGDQQDDLTDELLDHLIDRYGEAAGRPSRGMLTSEEIARINAHLASKIGVNVPIHELAAVARRGPSQFPRNFRRTFGLSPHQYVLRLRLRRARQLLGTGMPLAEAAIESGFVDQSHLTNWVRRLYGLTPGRWTARNGKARKFTISSLRDRGSIDPIVPGGPMGEDDAERGTT